MDSRASYLLLQRAQAGDVPALESLLRALEPAIGRWARDRLPGAAGGQSNRDDMIEEIVLQAIDRVKSVAPERPGSVPTCLRQVILDKMRDEFGPEGHRLPAQTREDALPPEEPSRLEQAIGRDALQRYEAALQRLPDIEREAILARIELRLNDDEVASALDEPSVEAARVTVNRAIVNLALIMTDLC